MSDLTPSEIRRRKKRTADFENDWYPDKKTSEIRRKQLDKFQKVLNLFWKKKYKVTDMYWWSSWKWYGWDMMLHPDAIQHDNIPIKGFPRKHKLVNGWSIPKEDLKYLYDGPLIDEKGNILVKHQSMIQKLVSTVSQLKPLSWIIMFILFCIRYRNEVKQLLEYLK